MKKLADPAGFEHNNKTRRKVCDRNLPPFLTTDKHYPETFVCILPAVP